MKEVVIVSGMRTPIGDFLGALKGVSCVDLGVIALKAAMEKASRSQAHRRGGLWKSRYGR